MLVLELRTDDAEQAMAFIQQVYINLPKCEEKAQTIDQSFAEMSNIMHTLSRETLALLSRDLDNYKTLIEDQTVKIGELKRLNMLQEIVINDRKHDIKTEGDSNVPGEPLPQSKL